MQTQLTRRNMLALMAASGVVGLTGCAKLGGDKAYKKAFYSAHVVYGADALGDIFETFQKGRVLSAESAKEAFKLTDQGLVAFDEVAKLLEQGLPVNSFDKARTIVRSIKAAVASGAIKFTSPKAESVYNNTIATVEITINLIEAINAGKKKEVAQLEAEQKAKADETKASILQADPTWYQEAIVRVSFLVSELTTLSNGEPDTIWPAVRERSTVAHAKNTRRLNP